MCMCVCVCVCVCVCMCVCVTSSLLHNLVLYTNIYNQEYNVLLIQSIIIIVVIMDRQKGEELLSCMCRIKV